eukprot:scaffold216684_cov10-Tisochrysis_lutea.AAC.1
MPARLLGIDDLYTQNTLTKACTHAHTRTQACTHLVKAGTVAGGALEVGLPRRRGPPCLQPPDLPYMKHGSASSPCPASLRPLTLPHLLVLAKPHCPAD